MTSAAEYRQYAQECIESAHATPDGPIRTQFLELAKLWTRAALLRESGNRSGVYDGGASPEIAEEA
jgi:hypothetical protein